MLFQERTLYAFETEPFEDVSDLSLVVEEPAPDAGRARSVRSGRKAMPSLTPTTTASPTVSSPPGLKTYCTGGDRLSQGATSAR